MPKTFSDWARSKEWNFKTEEVPMDLLIQELLDRYTAPVIPPCRICGAKLSIGRCGGGEPTVYACSRFEEDLGEDGLLVQKQGRSLADKHYRDSEYIDYKAGGDSLVIELINRFKKEIEKIRNSAVGAYSANNEQIVGGFGAW